MGPPHMYDCVLTSWWTKAPAASIEPHDHFWLPWQQQQFLHLHWKAVILAAMHEWYMSGQLSCPDCRRHPWVFLRVVLHNCGRAGVCVQVIVAKVTCFPTVPFSSLIHLLKFLSRPQTKFYCTHILTSPKTRVWASHCMVKLGPKYKVCQHVHCLTHYKLSFNNS